MSAHPGSGSKTRVLLVAYGGGHTTMLIPIYRKLVESGRFDPTFLGLTTGRFLLEKAGIPFISYRDLVVPGDEPALEIGRQLAARLPADRSRLPADETIAYLGLCYQDLVRQLGEEGAAKAYQRGGRQALLPLGPMERLFDRLLPGLVITTSSPRSEKAAILTARKRGVPAVCLIDLFGIPEVAYVGQPGYADLICAFAEQTKQTFVEAGRDPSEIVVTGNPAFDRWADPALPNKAAELRRQRGWEDKKVILWASQPEPSPNEVLPRTVDQEFFRMLARHPEWHGVLRPHPSEIVKYDSLPANVTISTIDDDLSALLAAADLVITFNSTLGLEGVLIGKPLVTIDVSVQCQYLPYSKMGLSTGVPRITDLERGVLEAMRSPSRPKEPLPVPGNATENIYQAILNLLR